MEVENVFEMGLFDSYVINPFPDFQTIFHRELYVQRKEENLGENFPVTLKQEDTRS